MCEVCVCFFSIMQITKTKFMKEFFAIIVLLVGFMSSVLLNAQTTTTNGPELNLNETASTCVLEDNDDFLCVFSLGRGMWSPYDDIVISKYDKHTNTLSEQVMDDDYEGRFVFLTNENTTANVVRFVANKKNKTVECQKASFPLGVKVPKKLVFGAFYSFPMTSYAKTIDYYLIYAVYNADRSRFAVVSMFYPTKERKNRCVEVAVFDQEGSLLWHKSGAIDFYTNFGPKNIKVASDGTVYVSGCELLRTKTQTEKYMYIVTCSQQGVFGYKEELEPQAYYEYKMAVLPNNELRLVGVSGETGKNDCKLKTYKANSNGKVDYVEEDIDFSPYIEGVKYDDKKLGDKKGEFTPYMFDLICLQNGNLFLVGEMRSEITVGYYRDTNFELTGYLSHNILCANVGSDGKLKEMNVLPRATVTSEEMGRWRTTNPVYAIEHKGDIYLMYNDHRDNFSGNTSRWKTVYYNNSDQCSGVLSKSENNGELSSTDDHRGSFSGKAVQWNTLYYNCPDQCSVVLSKLKNNGELSSTILYNAKTQIKDPKAIAGLHNHEFFLRLLQQEKDGMYYILKRDGKYHLEKLVFE